MTAMSARRESLLLKPARSATASTSCVCVSATALLHRFNRNRQTRIQANGTDGFRSALARAPGRVGSQQEVGPRHQPGATRRRATPRFTNVRTRRRACCSPRAGRCSRSEPALDTRASANAGHVSRIAGVSHNRQQLGSGRPRPRTCPQAKGRPRCGPTSRRRSAPRRLEL